MAATIRSSELMHLVFGYVEKHFKASKTGIKLHQIQAYKLWPLDFFLSNCFQPIQQFFPSQFLALPTPSLPSFSSLTFMVPTLFFDTSVFLLAFVVCSNFHFQLWSGCWILGCEDTVGGLFRFILGDWWRKCCFGFWKNYILNSII